MGMRLFKRLEAGLPETAPITSAASLPEDERTRFAVITRDMSMMGRDLIYETWTDADTKARDLPGRVLVIEFTGRDIEGGEYIGDYQDGSRVTPPRSP